MHSGLSGLGSQGASIFLGALPTFGVLAAIRSEESTRSEDPIDVFSAFYKRRWVVGGGLQKPRSLLHSGLTSRSRVQDFLMPHSDIIVYVICFFLSHMVYLCLQCKWPGQSLSWL